MNTIKKFTDLHNNYISEAIKINVSESFVINDQVMIPEVDILLCTYKSKRVNIKVDLKYGASIEAVDEVPQKYFEEIEKLIMSNLN
jgi:hypothetical protein